MHVKLPNTRTPERPSQANGDKNLYLRSYLLMRAVIGFIGIGLPAVLLTADGLFLKGEVPRGSVSAYYHTGVRDVFVGSLCTIAVFLITYLVFHYNWDNVLSIIAGVAALGVALFPTGGNSPLTPLQDRLGETTVTAIHYTSATIFISSLAIISIMFGHREGSRPDRTADQQKRGRMLHWACAAVIICAMAYVFITKLVGRFDEHSLFYGETVAAIAFGLSWLMKGLELKILLGRAKPTTAETAAAAASA